MYNMLPKIVNVDYEYIINNSNEFIFPITGLIISDNLVIGNVHFYNIDVIDYENVPFLKQFRNRIKFITTNNVKTFAYVNTTDIAQTWKDKCNNKLSIALMLLKQVIGFLYLTYYEYTGFKTTKRIIISGNNIHECEEGMDVFLASDGYLHNINVSRHLFFEPDIQYITLLKQRIGHFIELYSLDSEIKFKVIKLYESLYHLLNEIHSIERILKMSAFLQMVFLKEINESFQSASKRIKDFLAQNNKEKIINYNNGKLNNTLNEIYSEIRNKYSHGAINLYEEYNIISGSNYFIFYQVYMNVILLLTNSIDYNNIKSSLDLINQITQFRPSTND